MPHACSNISRLAFHPEYAAIGSVANLLTADPLPKKSTRSEIISPFSWSILSEHG
jgi:hypothetical protein